VVRLRFLVVLLILVLGISGCAARNSSSNEPGGLPKVLAVETFLQDISQNVAGDRLNVESLIPVGLDPHTFEPTPKEMAKVADSKVLIENGAGLETNLNRLMANAGGQRLVIDASSGLTNRSSSSREGSLSASGENPHYWLDPIDVIQYVKNIQAGLTKADPQGAQLYSSNAEAYNQQLNELDQWIRDQVAQIPPGRRLLVTNHEEFGYFADRYGFKVVGAIIPSFTSDASPSAYSVTQLIGLIRETNAPAVFLEQGTNPQLADQIASETGARVAPPLYTHSLTGSDGPAPTYIQMMKYDVSVIVDALK
jgi:ABC-type Zn uptake system ZnuABC Zn-binding protein ZnuA